MKKLKNFKGVTILSKTKQQTINGGKKDLCREISCVPEKVCINGRCVPRY